MSVQQNRTVSHPQQRTCYLDRPELYCAIDIVRISLNHRLLYLNVGRFVVARPAVSLFRFLPSNLIAIRRAELISMRH